ncbi:hypothetical protein GCM10010256_69920 [Streptomyces coeruleorubidus]|nr:hypothetical protein GCM10010256_69920 [Streptomyces coeruleorubidus]
MDASGVARALGAGGGSRRVSTRAVQAPATGKPPPPSEPLPAQAPATARAVPGATTRRHRRRLRRRRHRQRAISSLGRCPPELDFRRAEFEEDGDWLKSDFPACTGHALLE